MTTYPSNIKPCAYIRVSTSDQNTDMQLDAVKNYCKIKSWQEPAFFVDHGESGKKESRPQLDLMLKKLQAGEFNTILVYKFDRISRSTTHLIGLMNDFRTKNIDFISISENVDTSTPMGKMIFSIIAVLAEFERETIVQRTKDGLKAAKERGVKLGAKSELTDIDRKNLLKMYLNNAPIQSLQNEFKLSRSRVYAIISEEKQKGAF